jgi:hypothetical protein
MSSFYEISQYTNNIWTNIIWPNIKNNLTEHISYIQLILVEVNNITNIYKKLNLDGLKFSNNIILPSEWNFNCSLSNFCQIEISEKYENICLSENNPSKLEFWILPHNCFHQAKLFKYFLNQVGYSSIIINNHNHSFIYLDKQIFDPISLLYIDYYDEKIFNNLYS